MSDLSASMGIQQLRKLRGFQRKRSEIATRYNDCLQDLPLILPPKPLDGDVHAWHLYPILLKDDSPVSRDQFIVEMSQLGIGCSVHFIPLHLQPYWRDSCELDKSSFPSSQYLYEKEISIPLFTRMTGADVERVVRAVRKVLGR